MERLKVIIAVVVVIILAIVIFVMFGSKLPIPFLTQTPSVTIDAHTFQVTVAKTQQEKETGLSSRTSLAQNQGMYFPFDTPAYYGFWMKGMKFSIDIIFIRDNKIVTIFSNVPPENVGQILPVYKPTQPANAVLELNAGTATQDNFKEGDQVQISL